MDALARLLGGAEMRATYGPDHEFWYAPASASPSGMRVDSDAAQRISAWYRGREILAQALAMLPLPVYRRLPNDGGSEVAVDHPLYELLHNAPNGWQDSFQWRRQKMYHIIDHGNGYDEILPGPRGFVGALHPIHPRLVTPEQVASGRILYHIRHPKTGVTRTLTQDTVFHIRGASEDGIVGKGILDCASTSVGTALATETYAARVYSGGTLSSGVIEHPGVLDAEAGRRMAQSWITRPGEWHFPKILEQGSKWVPSTLTPEAAQMLLSRKFSIDDMARWLGVPRHMLENADPSFGNANQFDDNFWTYTMGGWHSLFEFAINNQLIVQYKTYYAEFNRDAKMRAEFLARAQGNVEYVNAGIKTVDEVRVKEGLNKRGGKADELRQPQNITGKPAADEPTPKAPADAEDEDDPPPARRAKAQALAVASAERVLRKETSAVRKLAVRHAADGDAFAMAVTDFYSQHVALVQDTLQMCAEQASAYCASQAAQVVAGEWVSAVTVWQSAEYAAGLAEWALDEERVTS